MNKPDPKTNDSFDLSRYRQAADIAYKYAKDKIKRDRSSKTEETDQSVFGDEKQQES